MTPDELAERLLDFALPATRLARHIAAQLVRSGTSPAPNYEEGCAAESREDFVHKLAICLKELRESRFWIRLTIRSGLLPERKMAEILDECDQLCKVIAQSLLTAKRNSARRIR